MTQYTGFNLRNLIGTLPTDADPTEVFEAFSALIETEGHDGFSPAMQKLIDRYGMVMDDNSDGHGDIQWTFRARGPQGSIRFFYFLVPVDAGEPHDIRYFLRAARKGSDPLRRDWQMDGDVVQLVEACGTYG